MTTHVESPVRVQITEANVRNIIYDEILEHMMMQEGIWDDVKQGAVKLRKAVAQKFGSAIEKWTEPLKTLSSVASKGMSELNDAMQDVKRAMKESGESFHMDETLQTAKQLAALDEQKMLAIVDKDLKGPVHDLAKKMNGTKAEAKFSAGLYSLLVTENVDINESFKHVLSEAFGPTTLVGLVLGGFGGAHLLFKGLSKLAGYLHMADTSQMFDKWAHVLHHTEEKTLDAVVPDKLAYYFYRIGRSTAKKFLPMVQLKRKDFMSFEQFKKNKKIRMSTKKAMYKILLAWLLFHGITGAVKAGFSVLGIAEGTASTVKGIEIAAGVGELVALSRGSDLDFT